MNKYAAMAVAGMMLFAARASASSLALSEFGARASGRGITGGAVSDDPSALFYNPANIAKLEGFQYSLGGSLLLPQWSYQALGGSGTEKNRVDPVMPPNFAATYRVGNTPLGELTLGASLSLPFGSSFDWGEGFSGNAQVETISLQVFEIAPVVTLRPSPYFAVSAGLRYLPSSVHLKRAVPFGTEVSGQADLGGNGAAWGAVLGLAVWPTESLSLGLSWRSAATLKMTGKSNLDFPAPFDTAANDGRVTAEIPLPQIVRLGAMYSFAPEFRMMADLEYQGWSHFKSIAIRLQNPDGTQSVNDVLQDARDTVLVHLGGELKLSEPWTVRAGYVYDPHAIPEANVSPMPPDSDRHLLTLGASYQVNEMLGLHASFTDVFFVQRKTATNDLPGTWSGAYPGGTMAYLFSLGASGKFDL